jgi:hypothetical protein
MFVSSPALLLTFYYTRVWDPTYLNKVPFYLDQFIAFLIITKVQIPRTRIPEPEPSKLQQSSTTMTNSISVKLNKNGSSYRTQRDSPYIPVFSSDDANVKSSDNFVNHLATLEVLPNNAAATEQTKQFSLHGSIYNLYRE